MRQSNRQAPMRRMLRWIDLAWHERGLVGASPQAPPVKLYLAPSAAMLLLAFFCDTIGGGFAYLLGISGIAAMMALHFLIVARLSYISSTTRISDC